MLIGFWWLFVIVTVTTYSGNLVAFLTFPKIESPVNTVEDLTNFRGVESWGFLAGSVIEDHLMRSSDPQFEILYKKAIKHAAFNKTVLDLVSHHQHAYIDWQIVLATAIRDSLRITGKCEYIVGSESFFEEKIALAVPKKSPYLPVFNKQIGQMSQTGLLKKWKSRYWPGKDRCSRMTISAGNRKVGVGDMQGSFYLLCLGFGVALVVLIIEVIVTRRKKKKMIDTLKILVGGAGKDIKFWKDKQFPFLQ
ncbi:Glutamate receptor 3 [Folsomia candida]|uniref:Glutamate receptor 3 n=2 Tax=Folsomia candida TaxID=158441 RepID=A0A226DPG5_FOLCA|nr:Glutamate receptor 3 [Folsomia candida]